MKWRKRWILRLRSDMNGRWRNYTEDQCLKAFWRQDEHKSEAGTRKNARDKRKRTRKSLAERPRRKYHKRKCCAYFGVRGPVIWKKIVRLATRYNSCNQGVPFVQRQTTPSIHVSSSQITSCFFCARRQGSYGKFLFSATIVCWYKNHIAALTGKARASVGPSPYRVTQGVRHKERLGLVLFRNVWTLKNARQPSSWYTFRKQWLISWYTRGFPSGECGWVWSLDFTTSIG